MKNRALSYPKPHASNIRIRHFAPFGVCIIGHPLSPQKPSVKPFMPLLKMPTPTAPRHHWLGVRIVLLLLGVAALAVSAHAAERRVALVMGNARYQQETGLRNPTNDAQLLARTLKARPLAFDEVLTLDNANRGQMLQQLARFGKLAQGADVALLYYSGHGMINSRRQNYVLPVDMPKISSNADLDTDAALKSYGVSETELIEAVEGARVQVVVLDACRDNGFGEQKSGSKGLARRADQNKNRLIAYATEEGHTAEDGKGQNSTYALSLARHLVRTDLPLLTVFDEVANDVERQTANKQSPTRSGNLRTSVYLLASLVPEPVPPPQPRPFSPSPAPVPVPAPSPAPVAAMAKCAECPEMVVIPGGSFEMGSSFQMGSSSSNNGDYDETPVHSVNVKSFELGKYEVTQGQWTAVMGSNPSHFKECGDICPVEKVSWNDIKEYIQKLNARSGQQYRLPSEAEWEYAARAGSSGKWSFGSDEGQLGEYGWYEANSGNKTHPVGQKKPNGFGVYDLHGNVWEWVQDCWHGDYKGAPGDGSAWTSSCSVNSRVLRGGSWIDIPTGLRSAVRDGNAPVNRDFIVGFRLARTLFTP